MRSVAFCYRRGFRLASDAQLVPQPRFSSIAEARDLPLFNQELQTRALAILAITFFAKHRSYRPAQLDCFVRINQNAQVFGEARCCRKSAADSNAKCCAAALGVV